MEKWAREMSIKGEEESTVVGLSWQAGADECKHGWAAGVVLAPAALFVSVGKARAVRLRSAWKTERGEDAINWVGSLVWANQAAAIEAVKRRKKRGGRTKMERAAGTRGWITKERERRREDRERGQADGAPEGNDG